MWWLRDAAALLSLPVLVALLYGSATRLWWLSDDFFNLRYVRDWRPAQYCLDPAVWQRLPFRMLTPLVFVSYDVDLALFGWNPRGFYFHELASLVLAAMAVYVLMRLFHPLAWALAAAGLFLAGVPVAAAVAPMLMGRHYVEALLLALLATIAWVQAMRARRPAASWTLAVLSAVLWLAAALAKEIAVPMVLLLPLLPEGDAGRRLRRVSPHGVALVAYLAYRRYLMGVWIGGYGWAVEGTEWLRLLMLLPGRLAREMAGGGSPGGWLAVALTLAGCLALAAKDRRAAFTLAIAAALAVLPVLPVASEVTPRYAVAPWLLVAIGFVAGARCLRGGRWLVTAALLAVLVANRQAWAAHHGASARQSAENRALMELGGGDVVRLPAGPPASLEELHRFAREVAGREGGAWYLDDIYLCLDHPLRRLWEYDTGAARVVEITGRLAGLRRRHCDGRRQKAPLTADFRFGADGVLRWSLGPYEDGRWSFVLRDGIDAYPVPRQAAFQLAEIGAFPLRVRYDSPAGWTTYSPVLPLELQGSWSRTWRRPTTPPRGSS